MNTVWSRTKCVQARRQARLARIYGPSAVAGCLTWPLVDDVLGLARMYPSATLLLWVLSGPVLKHGPRSLTCTRVIGTFYKPKGEMKVKVGLVVDGGRMARVTMRVRTPGASRVSLRAEAHPERTRWDPKDGELCLVRTKSGETLMEVRSDSDVQIDRRNWV